MHNFMSSVELISRGGFMMFPLLISALIALTVIFERLYLFHRVYFTSPKLVSNILKQIQDGQFKAALELCETNPSPITTILSSGIEHFEHPIEEMELSMKNQAEAWIPRLEKRIELLDTVITAAPLMGLLGTITGMMASFQVLSEKGINEPNAITGGVAEALIATATGLVIALFCLLAFNYLTAQVKIFIHGLEAIASKILELKLATLRSQKNDL